MKLSETKYAELIPPHAIGVLMAIATYMWLGPNPKWEQSAKELFPSTLNISAIIVGFLATAKSIMFALMDRQRVRDLRSSGQFNLLINYLLLAIFWAFVAAVFSAINVVMYPGGGVHLRILLTAWIGSVAATFAWFYQVVQMLARLLRTND